MNKPQSEPMRTSIRQMLPESVLHEIHRRVDVVERRANHKIVRLHVGEPCFSPPEIVQKAVTKAIYEGRTGYTSAEGLEELRERLAERVVRNDRIAATPSRIIVTPGSTQALLAIMLATCDPGDEILLPWTHWPIYQQSAAIAGLRIRFYDLGNSNEIDPDRAMSAATATTRLLLINSPANPSGYVCAEHAMRELVSAAQQRGMWIIADEAYEHFVYEGRHHSAASFECDVSEADRRVFTVRSFSKSYAMTGYRIGYAIAPSNATASRLRRIQEGSIVAPSTPIQYGALAALEDSKFITDARSYVKNNRDNCLEDFRRMGLLRTLPAGGWYALIDISPSGMTSEYFAARLLAESEVSVAPGSAFVPKEADDPQTVRVAICGGRERLNEGLSRLREFVEKNAA